MKLKLTIDQIMQIAGKNSPLLQKEKGDGRPVIVRSRDAGVLFGNYDGRDGDTIFLKGARQLYRWYAQEGGTLIDVAELGVIPEKCKFSPSKATVTIFNACALIDVSESAAQSLSKVGGDGWK